MEPAAETSHILTAEDVKALEVPSGVMASIAALNDRMTMLEVSDAELREFRERIAAIERALSKQARGGSDADLFDIIFGHLGIVRPD